MHPGRTTMILLTLLATSFLCFTRADSAINAETTAAQKCALDLEQTIAQPETNSKQYMKMIAANFNSGSRLLFTPYASSYISNFEQEWGVTVQVNDPSNICVTDPDTCSFVNEEPFNTIIPGDSDVITFPIPQTGFLSSMSLDIPIGGILPSDNPSIQSGFPNITLTSPSGTEIVVSTITCPGTSYSGIFNVIFADGGAALVCTNDLRAGNIYAPVQPFSTFYGENPAGNWTLKITANSIVSIDRLYLNYCVTPPPFCPSNHMQALRNIPGFRYDSGIVYYTEVVFNCDGQMKMVTISRPINGLFIKK